MKRAAASLSVARYAWMLPAALAAVLVAGYVLQEPAGPSSGDTVALVHGAHSILSCIAHGITSGCDSRTTFSTGGIGSDTYHGTIEGDVAPYALFQYLPATALIKLGFGDAAVYRGLTIISLVSFIGLLAAGGWVSTQARQAWPAPMLILTMTASPLLLYAGLTFGESLAALLVGVFAVATLRRWRPPLLAMAALTACLTKETAFPIILLLGTAGLIATPVGIRELRRSHWIGLAAGIVLGVAVSGVFNWFRYHQLTNFTYGHSFEQVPGLGRRLGLAVALWVAPNAGIAMFWTLAALVCLAIVIGAGRTLRTPLDRTKGAHVALVAAMLIVTATLASWWSPFGWDAWGPRLVLPVLPAVVMLGVVICAGSTEKPLERLLAGRLRLGALILVIAAVGLPQVNVLHHTQALSELFSPDLTCPSLPSVVVDPHAYYRCLSHMAWGRHWILLDSFYALQRPWGLAFAAGFVLVWASLVFLIAHPRGGCMSQPALRS